MNKFNYLKINKYKKIRYLKYSQKNTTYIVFLHGFMSDLEGKKPHAFLNFAKKNKLGIWQGPFEKPWDWRKKNRN